MIRLRCEDNDENLKSNHEANKSYPSIKRIENHRKRNATRTAVICAPGHSLRENIDQVRAWSQSKDYDLFAVKSGSILEQAGIVPTYAVHVDTKPTELERLWFNTSVKYLVSSQCMPEVFRELRDKGCTVYKFHSRTSATWNPHEPIASGSNTTLQTAFLAKWFGYTRIILVGFDCSWPVDSETHTTGNRELTTRFPRIELQLGSKRVFTNVVLVGAAQEAVRALYTFGSGVQITALGDYYAQAFMNDVVTGRLDMWGVPIAHPSRPESFCQQVMFPTRMTSTQPV